MKFTLITKNGYLLTFFVRAVAIQYQQAYGGTIITNEIFETETV